MEEPTVTVPEVEPKVGDLPEEKPAAALPDEAVPEQMKEDNMEEAPGNYNPNSLNSIFTHAWTTITSPKSRS